jgi:glycosyltransferase involved in cell wall biosynthesis
VRACVLIPHFNHDEPLAGVLDALAPLGLPTLVVDDGSDAASYAQVRYLAASRPWVRVDRGTPNRGKGAAILRGLAAAQALGYTHAVQIDADGQHDATDIPAMLALAAAEPRAIVSGRPVYDASVPRSRLHGRKISLFWLRLETLSPQMGDAMCGFRVYPVAETLALAGPHGLGTGMEFDAEVLARAHWAGLPVLFRDTRVVYPAGGRSHFRMVRDNARISLMHARLFFGMLRRLPQLMARSRPTRAPR